MVAEAQLAAGARRIKVAVTVGVWLTLAAVAVGTDVTCKHVAPSLKLTGDVSIVALLDGHSGANCTTPDAKGLQEMATLAWMVNSLNHWQFIPGIKLGLSLYDTCSTAATAESALVTYIAQKKCAEHYFLGVLTTPTISASLQPLMQLLQTPITLTKAQFISPASITYAIAQLLSMHHITTIDHLVASSSKTLESFVRLSRELGICILQNHLTGRDSGESKTILSGMVVVVGSWDDIKRIGDFEQANTQFILVPSGTVDTSVLAKVSADAVIISSNPVVLRPPNANTSHSDVWASVNRHVFLDVAATLLHIVDRLKAGLSAHCIDAAAAKICNNLPSFHQLPPTHTNSPIHHLFDALQIRADNDNANFYTLNRLQRDANNSIRLEKLAVFRIQDETHNHTFEIKMLNRDKTLLTLDNSTKRCNLFVTNSTNNEYLCRKCFTASTLNREVNLAESHLFSTVSFRHDGWVAALVSIASMGVLCCLAVGIFIVVRKCNGDVLEGNPSFSFLLLLAIVFTYASIVPFGVRASQLDGGALCGLRIFATCTSYALTFSIMLSRSLMLASCDKEGGFMSHVNGYLQTVLCFFMFGVQLALSVQFWIINTQFSPTEQCKFSEGSLFLVILSYDAFLLLILLCTTPFIVHSKRNYREGMFFAAGTVLCTAVWIAWVLAYVLLPDHRDAVIAGGLTSTATAVLLAVFIPRTYLMMSALTRDNIANALPAMAYSSTSILDLNYRSSNQALYATVNVCRGETVQQERAGQANPNYYADLPHHGGADERRAATAKAKCQSGGYRDDVSPEGENTYERYDTPPSPLKITRF